MTARARLPNEPFDEYKIKLRFEDFVLKSRLKGTWSWKTYFPITTMENAPRDAKIFIREEVKNEHDIVIGHKFVSAKSFEPEVRQHYIKLPPYRNVQRARRPDRNTRALRRYIKNARRQIKIRAQREAAALAEQGGGA